MKKLQKKLIFLIIFTFLGFVFLQIPFNKLAGSNVSFTLFDFFAPIAGVFLGPILGIASVLSVEIINIYLKQAPLTTGTIIRLFPILFAVLYFSVITKRQGKWLLIIPIISIVAFLSHPVGRQIPYYPLMFWVIPIIAYQFKSNLVMRGLGATFTAHSVGGAAWIWAFNLPASVWQGLIPVVIAERLLFAMGIAGSFVVVKQLLSYLASKHVLPKLEISQN